MTSDGNNFNDFPENQLTIDFDYLQAYLREPYCITVLPCPDIIGGGAFPRNIWGNGDPSPSPSTTPLVRSNLTMRNNEKVRNKSDDAIVICKSIFKRWTPPLQQTASELWRLSGGKRGDYQNCSVLYYYVLKLRTVISILRWEVLWIGFCLTGPNSLCVDLFVFLCIFLFHTA